MEDKMKISVLSKLAIILCLALCISLMVCACGSNNEGSSGTPNDPPHTHVYVDGKCECGEFDPNFDINDLDKPGNSDDNTVTYTVTVVDQNGAPVVGVYVQMCVGDLCKLPMPTNADGVVVFENFDPADYSVKVNGAIGYTVEGSYHFAAGSTELTITLTKIAEAA